MIQNAIQAAIALLKKSAQDLADGVSIGGVPQWESEPSTEGAHDEILIAADGLVSASAYITRIESENAAHLAYIARLESQLAAEVERLDFVIGESAFIERYAAGSQLKAACQFGEEAVISGDGFHPTPRAAIDAARGLAKGGA